MDGLRACAPHMPLTLSLSLVWDSAGRKRWGLLNVVLEGGHDVKNAIQGVAITIMAVAILLVAVAVSAGFPIAIAKVILEMFSG